MRQPWFPMVKRRASPALRLICLAHAGGGASAYRAWQELLPESIEVWAAQLPGREGRFPEPPLRRVPQVIAPLVEAVEALGDLPVALFGHSLGAVLGFELARELVERGRVVPVHLFASAHAAPHQIPPRQLHTLDDEAFVKAIGHFNGIPPAVLEHRDLLDLLLPIVKADFELIETYAHRPGPPLPVPITALGGDADPAVAPGDLEGWRALTARFEGPRLYAGDHFYLEPRRRELLAWVGATLGG